MRIRRPIWTVLLLLAACTVPGGPQPGLENVRQAASDIVDPRELIVLSAQPVAPVIAEAEARGYVTTAQHPLPELDDVLLVFRIPEGRTIPEAIEEIEEASPGVTAGAHHVYRLQIGDAGDSGRFYANALIGWPASGCRAVRSIGMIDAGVGAEHGGLAADTIVERRFFAGDAAPANDHGTVMADLLVGPGRLSAARLYSANVVDPTRGDGDATGVVAILRAVDWLRGQGVDLVNISLAGPRNKLLDRGLGRAAEDGLVLVAAAGNDGPTAPPRYPAAFPFVLAVTAVDRELEVFPGAVRGAHIDLAAPGVDILREEAGRLQVSSGTSAATPFVTAAIAADPTLRALDADAVRRQLAAEALDIGATGKDPVFGAGLVVAPLGCRAP